MRKVNLTREKSFVACLAVLRILVEDVADGDININGTPCRLVAYVKNGETVSFEIGNEATKIYVIADKMSKNYCNDYYPVPEGDADLEIGGKCKYNPALGNAFRFNGVTDEAALKNRKRSGYKGIVVMVAAVLVGFALGIFANLDIIIESPKTFNCADFDITLTSAFDSEVKNGEYYFYSNECAVTVYEYSFDEYTDLKAMSDAELIDLLKENSFFSSDAELAILEGLTVVEDTSMSVGGDNVNYFTVFMRDEEGTFLFTFGCMPEDYEGYRATFIEWAKSIKLK